MLVDLTPRQFRREDYRADLQGITEEELREIASSLLPVRIGQGQFQLNHWNPEHGVFEEKLRDRSFGLGRSLTSYERSLPKCDQDTIWRQLVDDMWARVRLRKRQMDRYYSQTFKKNWPGEVHYGVCDYPNQVLERWPHLTHDDVPRIICYVELRREDQEPRGGWRYHKWGPYIGRQRPQHEYLYDDTHIDVVWTYHVYEVEQ